MLSRQPLTVAGPDLLPRLFILGAAAAAAFYGAIFGSAHPSFVAGLLVAGVLVAMPTKVQFVLLILALQLPPGFAYTTRSLAGVDLQISDVLIASLAARAMLAWWSGTVPQVAPLRQWMGLILLFVLWTGLTQIVSHLQSGPLPEQSWTGWARATSYMLLVPVFGVLTIDQRRLSQFVALAMWLVVAQSLFGLFLRFVGPQSGISPETIFLISGEKSYSEYGGTAYRITGLFGSAGALGLAAAVFTSIWMARWLAGPRGRRKRTWLAPVPIFVLMAAAVFSLSRRSMLGASGGLILVFALSRRGMTWRGWLAAGVIVAALTFLWPTIAERFGPELFPSPETGGELTSLGGRQAVWKEALPLILSNPVFGLGWGMFGVARGLPDTYSHSLYAETALSFGIPGLLLLLAAMWLVVRNARFLMREGRELQWLGLGMVGAVAATAISGIFVHNLLTDSSRMFWLVAGLQLCAVRVLRHQQAERAGEEANVYDGTKR